MSTIGDSAREIARKKILDKCKQVKLTPLRVLQRISEGLDATETRTAYDKDRGRWSYSEPLVDHGHRLEAAGMGVMIHSMKPCDKMKVEITGFEDTLRSIYNKRQGKKTQPG